MNLKIKKNKSAGFLSLSILFAELILTACNSQPKNPEITTETLSPMTDTTTSANQDWEQFKQDANRQIADANDSISSFKLRVKKLNGKIKVKYEDEIARLQEKNDALKAKLDSFKKVESKDNWDGFKMKFNDDMAKIKATLRDSTDVNQK